MKQLSKSVMMVLGLSFTVASTGCTDQYVGEEFADDEASPTEDVTQALTTAVQVEANCGGKSEVYCVTVNLKDGAKLKPYPGSKDPITALHTDDCRGGSNGFTNRTVKGFSQVSTINYDGYIPSNAKVLVSGSFHNDNGKPAFPQKFSASSAWIGTYGYECSAAGGANSMKILWIRNAQGRAFIEPFDLAKFNDSTSAPEAITGLDPYVDKGLNTKNGRNYVGLINPYNGGYGTVIFVVAMKSPGITQYDAINILTSKGCSTAQIMQLDGSTVAQMSENNNGSWIHHPSSATRAMPQAFGIFVP